IRREHARRAVGELLRVDVPARADLALEGDEVAAGVLAEADGWAGRIVARAVVDRDAAAVRDAARPQRLGEHVVIAGADLLSERDEQLVRLRAVVDGRVLLVVRRRTDHARTAARLAGVGARAVDALKEHVGHAASERRAREGDVPL